MTQPLKGARVTDEPGAAPEPQRKTFNQFVLEQRRGLFHDELSEALADAGRAVREHKKAATITVQIKIAPAKYDGAVEVSDDVKVKLPVADRDSGLFYPDQHGNLNRSDPRQPQLPFHTTGTSGPRAVDQNRSAS